MNRWSRTALAVGAVGAGLAAEHLMSARARRRPDPAADDDFTPIEDALHHTIEMDDGGRVHVVERGRPDAQPIVLLHGVTLSTVTWHYQLLDLADRFRVLAVDHRGHGKSTGGGDGYTVERIATDVAEVLSALDLRHAVLVGHSMGGMATMQFLVDHPRVRDERVAGVVLVATAAGAVAPAVAGVVGKVTQPLNRRTAGWIDRRKGGWFPSNDLSYGATRLVLGRRASPTHVELTRAMTAAVPYGVVSQFGYSLVDFDTREKLPSVPTPALVVVGTADLLTPPRYARSIARRLPHAELVVLQGCGHMVMLERRRELDELISGFADKLARS